MRFLPLRQTPATSWFIPLFALAAIAGCGKSSPYACVPASGKVTYDDGSLIPADQIQLVFVSLTPPIDPKTPPKNGIAYANGNTGTFDYASTFGNKDGIVVGEHKVVVQCLRKAHLIGNLVPAEFTDAAKTPLKTRTGDGPLTLKVPKPRKRSGGG
jgi:hypothetical protein